jgi:hypothetical protein
MQNLLILQGFFARPARRARREGAVSSPFLYALNAAARDRSWPQKDGAPLPAAQLPRLQAIQAAAIQAATR